MNWLKLGFSVAQSTVAKYMVKRHGPPSQGWRTFLAKPRSDIAAIDLFVVPAIGFKLLYGFVIIRIDRRDLAWINVTNKPTAEWIAGQITEAFPRAGGSARHDTGPRSDLWRRAMGIRDKPIAPASPWRNGFAERLIGSIRRDVILGEVHLRRILNPMPLTTTAHQNIDLSILLKRRDWGAIPWGILGSVALVRR